MSAFAREPDVAVVGGGLVGLATALSLATGSPRRSVVVLEAEAAVAAHQSSHNSGVVHSGLYYAPGSAKARLCAEGRHRLVAYCGERGVALAITGKLVVATREDERARLEGLESRGRANGLTGLRRLSPDGMREIEPHAVGLEALHVPEAGVVDFPGVARALAADVEAAGGAVVTGARVTRVARDGARLAVETTAGTFLPRFLVACAGLQADRLARMAGLRPAVSVVPFRGDYFALVPARAHLVRALVYPVPDPRFPFLGVHFTRRIGRIGGGPSDAPPSLAGGIVEVGPNAVVALDRNGYGRYGISPRDALDAALFPGLWRFVARHLQTAAGEVRRTLSRAAFARAARVLVPELRDEDLVRAGCGIRAMAMRPDGGIVDDFEILEAPGMVHVLNAPSPAATACLAIGDEIARRARAQLD